MWSRLFRLGSCLRSTLGRQVFDDEATHELEAHAELLTDRYVRSGMAPDEARLAARRQLGNLTLVREEIHRLNTIGWLEGVLQDLRYAARALRKAPLFTLTSVLVLALGIGATTAIFSVVNSVLIKPLPYPMAEELVSVSHTAPGAEGQSGDLLLSTSMFFTYADENRTFQHFGLWIGPGPGIVTGLAEPEEIRRVLVTYGTLQALNVQPVLGRWLEQGDQVPQGPETVMLTYGYWQRRFGGDTTVIGRNITVGARPREIVGVMPEGFRMLDAEADLIEPFRFPHPLGLGGFGYRGIARLKPGVTLAEANTDVARMLPIWMSSWPSAPGANSRVLETWRIAPALRLLKQDVVGTMGSVLWVVMATIGIVMLIACVNVANLLLVRAEGRQQELAIRAALGAGAGRIVRALLVESVLLGLMGGALGLALAYVGLHFLLSIAPAGLPRLSEIAVDTRALGFTLVLSLLSGLLFGSVPALKYARPQISAANQSGGRPLSHSRERHWVRDVLVVAQVALALVLLVSAGLMIRTLQALHTIEPGFTQPEHIQTTRINIPALVAPEPQQAARMHQSILDTLAAIPGVTSVAFSNSMPMPLEGVGPPSADFQAEGRTDDAGGTHSLRTFKYVSPGLFQTTGTRLIAGRDLTWTDIYDRRPVAIVSENLSRELWGTPIAALGKRIRAFSNTPWREVIGVVQDVRDNGVHEHAPTIVYWPFMVAHFSPTAPLFIARSQTFAIRSPQAGTSAFLRQVQEAVWSVNGNLALSSVRTMQDLYDRSLARTSFALVMLSIAGAMALVLGIVGIYGVVSYVVSQRTREIGIRLALGAQPGALTRMFVSQSLVLAGVGVAIGLGAASALTRFMSSLLFGISPLDPFTYIAGASMLVLAAALAGYLPARRASSVDPVQALKSE